MWQGTLYRKLNRNAQIQTLKNSSKISYYKNSLCPRCILTTMTFLKGF